MTPSKSVSWSALVNIGNNESLALTVSGEAANPDEARDIFAFACGQLLGVANSADAATSEKIRAYVSRLVQEEEAKPAVRDEKQPTVKLEAPPAKEPWTPKITRSSYEQAQAEKAAKQDAAALQQRATLAKEALIAKSGGVADQNAKPEKTPTIEEQAAAAVAACIKPPAPQPAPTAPPVPEASAPAERPVAPLATKPAPDGGVCEVCGAPVTKSQAKLSQLFLSKTTCKGCMEAAR